MTRAASATLPVARLSKPETLARGVDTMRMTTRIDEFIRDRRDGTEFKRALSPASLRRYYASLIKFADWLSATRGKDSVLHFNSTACRTYIRHRQDVETDLKDNTIAVDCAVLREFAAWGVDKRYWRSEDVHPMPAVVKPSSLPRSLMDAERDRIMALPLDGQDVVLRALLYYTGCRQSELRYLRLKDVTPPHDLPDTTRLPGQVRVLGKGRKERSIPIHDALWLVLEPHLRDIARVRKSSDAYVLDRPNGKPWTPQMVINHVARWGKVANVEGLVPHRLRHTLASNFLEATDDLNSLRDLLGHSSLTTTQGYARVVERKRAAGVAKLPTFVHSPRSFDPGEAPPARS